MISTSLGLTLLLATLVAFAVIGFRARGGAEDVERYLIARGSQDGRTLGLSFLASGLGAFVLFSPPEIGALLGPTAVVGYGLAAAAPLVVFTLLGSRLRKVVPAGHSLTEFVRLRFGRTFHSYVLGISILYMAVFLTAELTAVAGVVSIISGLDAWITVLAVAVITLAYTAYGGLIASLITDRWQAWLVIGLLGLGAIAMFGGVEGGPGAAMEASGLTGVTRAGIETGLTLIIAVTAANIFHQGYWQRVWAARDDAELRRGAILGSLLIIPTIIVAGLLGTVAVGSGADLSGGPSTAVFALLGGLPSWVGAVVLVLGVALVASSVDTLENGLASLTVAEAPRLDLRGARIATVVLMVPCTIVALQGLSVLRLFLIADLLAAATAVPALLGLWRRATSTGVLAGAVAGLLGAVGASVATTDAWSQAWAVVSMDGPPLLAPFLGALVASTFVAVLASLGGRTSADLEALNDRVPVLATTSA